MAARVPLIFGTMTMGVPGKNGVRNSDLKECQEILDTYFASGYKELDTARMYAEGTTEEYLSKLDLHDSTVDTKCYPVNPGDHSPEKLRTLLGKSLAALSPVKARVFYLHAPDRSVPWVETLRETDKLHREGKFEILGLSNFASWEVAEIVGICERNGFVKPGIYQAMYNALVRGIEPELVPCLRKFNVRLVIYNPLAGGLLAGKIGSLDQAAATEGRFSGDSNMAKLYRGRYFKDSYFEAVESIKKIAEKHQLSMPEIALRWCQHHSLLKPEDGVILGASSAEQLRQNCVDSTKGPLPEDVVDTLNTAWLKIAGVAPLYWR